MIETLKSIVGLDPISSLSHKSGKIVDIFTSTISKLTEVNNEASKEIVLREDKKRELEAEVEQLASLREANAKVIEKLTKVFE